MKQHLPTDAKGWDRVKARPFACTGARSRILSWSRSVLCAACFLIPRLLVAQGINLGWSAVAAGGGTSAGGNYILNATVGEPFGGGTYGDNYAVVAGFEGIVENVEPVAPPILRIARAGANSVVVLWPASATGWVLQETPTLGDSANWTDVSPRVVVNGADNTATLPLVPGNRYYRLRHP
ncbi:MAG TPA: hypothetical protein VN578_05590 [Candidatus Binatia bacterium]|jgi:hypothetical protein|nr:hypothetical protein [Candidatus Binatia bacterium]